MLALAIAVLALQSVILLWNWLYWQRNGQITPRGE